MAAGQLSREYDVEIRERAERLRNKGVEVYVIGLGSEMKPSKLEQITQVEENVFAPENLDKEKPAIVRKIKEGRQAVFLGPC